MNILITGHHVELTPAIREYVETKLERVISHFDQVIDVAVVLGVEAPAEKEKRQRAEANLRIKGDVIHAECYAENLYAAIDMMMDKLDRQVQKIKGKTQGHRQESQKRAGEVTAEDEL
ncbi:ribosome hibernation-promoting factor, HPF/YfiA family [Noviherbaspirillum suwonense]|jgi:putative sigma-54 modulation protein|uniref:Ribosome hibernation promoting factor n=1 Tax=Noviherbaspirillum suwonense TaxID=1224511 RepID=A0ABY1PXK1_9BURK|nr:ribosome-associated translation inhibitor RaiA [Noviherbaspirillum suwonense]SMP48743.1 putative sigma-54 modulation protein [Noviherbaspirillum suwonense]